MPKKLKIRWSLPVDFHFNIHLTISLADMEDKERERKKSIKSRETEKHSYASTHASCDHDSFCGTFHL